jgi:hypothetical protein
LLRYLALLAVRAYGDDGGQRVECFGALYALRSSISASCREQRSSTDFTV